MEEALVRRRACDMTTGVRLERQLWHTFANTCDFQPSLGNMIDWKDMFFFLFKQKKNMLV
jgi:hypothetical protein